MRFFTTPWQDFVEPAARVQYALLTLLEMASRYHQKEPLKNSEIRAKQAIPDRYLEQILTNLRRSGIVQSQRGAKGGYVLSREPWRITGLEIIAAVEGDRSEKATEVAATVERNLIHEVWQQAKSASHSIFGYYTLQNLCQRRNTYQQISSMYHI